MERAKAVSWPWPDNVGEWQFLTDTMRHEDQANINALQDGFALRRNYEIRI